LENSNANIQVAVPNLSRLSTYSTPMQTFIAPIARIFVQSRAAPILREGKGSKEKMK
jgi:hypothetical protein